MTPVSVLVNCAACIGEVDVLDRRQFDVGQPVAFVVECVVESLLYEFLIVRTVQKQVAIEVSATIGTFLDVSDIHVNIVVHL